MVAHLEVVAIPIVRRVRLTRDKVVDEAQAGPVAAELGELELIVLVARKGSARKDQEMRRQGRKQDTQ